MAEFNSPASSNTNTKAKYITLVVLVLWVIAVFVMTCLKFAKVW